MTDIHLAVVAILKDAGFSIEHFGYFNQCIVRVGETNLILYFDDSCLKCSLRGKLVSINFDRPDFIAKFKEFHFNLEKALE